MPRNTEDDHRSPVSFDVNIARLPQKGMPVRIEANAEQRAALAAAHGLESVESYVADLQVTAWKRHGVRVSGSIRAKITQTCVVTLEPLDAVIDEDVEGLFLPDNSKLGRQGFETGGEIVIDVDGDDAPETFSGDHIDVGALSEEFFGLAIDPYPRKPGADVPARQETADEAPAAEWKAKLAAHSTRKP